MIDGRLKVLLILLTTYLLLQTGARAVMFLLIDSESFVSFELFKNDEQRRQIMTNLEKYQRIFCDTFGVDIEYKARPSHQSRGIFF